MCDVRNEGGDIFVAVLHLRLARFQLAQPCDQPPFGGSEMFIGDMIGTFSAEDALKSVQNPPILAPFADESNRTDGKNGENIPDNQPRRFKILL